MMFSARVHNYLMPTDLFVRRPLLWMTLASRIGATLLCSPNFGYRHYLKVLGDRSIEGLDLSPVRLIFNGAEPISVPLCKEFLDRLEPAKLRRNAMFPCTAWQKPRCRSASRRAMSPLQVLSLNRHKLGVVRQSSVCPPQTRMPSTWSRKVAPFRSVMCGSRGMMTNRCRGPRWPRAHQRRERHSGLL